MLIQKHNVEQALAAETAIAATAATAAISMPIYLALAVALAEALAEAQPAGKLEELPWVSPEVSAQALLN